MALFIFLLLFSIGHIASAADTAATMPVIDPFPIPTTTPVTDIFGQNQYYTITLRGNGELAISGRISFLNTDNSSVSKMKFETPQKPLEGLVIYQAFHKPICQQYDYQSPDVYYDKNQQMMPDYKITRKPEQPRCLAYREPEYYDYLSGQNTYTKVTYTYENNIIDVSLPHAISSGSSGSLLVFYRLKNATTRTLLGGYTYEFQTLKTEDTVHIVQVGISTDSDLFIKGAKGKVQYSPTQYMDSAIMKNAAAGVSSPQLDMYYQQIGQGSEVKSASNLQPLDSYTVKGIYADAQWKLYGNEIGIAMIVFVVLIGLFIFVVKKFIKTPQLQSNRRTQSIILVGVLSTVSTFCIVTYTIGVYFMTTMLQSGYYYQSSIIISLLVFVVSCGVYLILLIGPGLWIGVTRGIAYGVSTVILTVFILGFALVLIIGSMFITRNPNSVPYPMPMGISGSTSTVAPDMK